MTHLLQTELPLAEGVTLKHPFRRDTIEGRAPVQAALADLMASVPASPEPVESFRGDAAQAILWQLPDAALHGCTLALLQDGQVQELRILLRPAHEAQAWVEANRALAPEGIWDVPKGNPRHREFDRLAPVDPHFPFEVADNAVFASPILRRKPQGAELVKTVIGHASAIYGQRDLGPRLGSGARRFSYWTGSVEGLPAELAVVLAFNAAGEMESATVFMQPLPVTLLFRENARHRLRGILDDSYFDQRDAD